jgi:hypothetical protein
VFVLSSAAADDVAAGRQLFHGFPNFHHIIRAAAAIPPPHPTFLPITCSHLSSAVKQTQNKNQIKNPKAKAKALCSPSSLPHPTSRFQIQ